MICKDIENKNKIVLERSARLKLETKPSGISTPIFGPLLQKLPESIYQKLQKSTTMTRMTGLKELMGVTGLTGVDGGETGDSGESGESGETDKQVNQVKGEKKEKSLVSGEEREGERKKKLPADGWAGGWTNQR